MKSTGKLSESHCVNTKPLSIKPSRRCFRLLTSLALVAAISAPAFGQDKEKGGSKKGGQPSEAEMMEMMMALAKPGENHKLLERGVGNWTYTVKAWMSPDPSAPPSESKGTATTKAVMGGRYLISEASGLFQMPGADGKMMDMEFKGMSVEGYDNVKKKFVSSWIDNMGTGIMSSEGTYDPAAKSFTYLGEYEPIPGMKTKVRQVIKITDHDHHTFEFFEDRGGKDVKTMEINYTRKG